jgi:hypothetical protein
VLELRYRESRITKADEMIEDRAAQFLRAPAETRYLIAPQHGRRRSWRKHGLRRSTMATGNAGAADI